MEVVILTGIMMNIGIIPQSVCQGDDVSLTLPFNPSFSPKLGNESGPRLRLFDILSLRIKVSFFISGLGATQVILYGSF